jgi:hypothetical protein
MKRIFIVAAMLFTLVGMSVVSASVASASVCQSNGTSCTAAGTYSGPNAVINGNYGAFSVVWTSSVVPSYSTVPSPWTVYITYTNVTLFSQTLGCPGNWVNASYVSEEMSDGSGNDGGVAAASTTCSQNPGLNVTVPSGGTYRSFATFGNVPWPGSTVAIQWGDAGTTASVTPWICPKASSPWGGYVACGVNADSVSAKWNVPPAIQDGNPNSGAAFWVGLGGTTTNLEQTGTASDMVNGSPVYLAWYELTPAKPIALSNKPVQFGDIMSGTVSLTNGDQYHFALTDHGPPGSSTDKWVFTKTVTYSKGGHNSGEALAEDSGGRDSLPPGCPLTDFSTVAFSGIKIDGYSIGSYHPSVYQMVDNKATVSSLRNGTAYTAYFQHS